VSPPTPEEAATAQPQPNATLAVTPAETERLVLAESQGKLRLVLRAAGDAIRMASGGVTMPQLLGGVYYQIQGQAGPSGKPIQITQRRLPPRPPRRQVGRWVGQSGYQGGGPAPVFASPLPPFAATPIAAAGMQAPTERKIEVIRGGKVERVTVKY